MATAQVLTITDFVPTTYEIPESWELFSDMIIDQHYEPMIPTPPPSPIVVPVKIEKTMDVVTVSVVIEKTMMDILTIKRKIKKKKNKNKYWSQTNTKATKNRKKIPNIKYPDNWAEKRFTKQSEIRSKNRTKNWSKNNTLILKNLPYDSTVDKDLERFFARNCGDIKYVNVLRNGDKCKGIAFIRFQNTKGSDKGMKLDGFYYSGRKIRVEYTR